MPSFSPFWHKHYKDIGFCCTFQPLEESGVTFEKDDPYVIGCIDKASMTEKKLKWIGTNRSGEAAWIDPYGMVYTLNDLKRNERGKEYEKGGKKLELKDHSDIRQYSDEKIDHYEWELEVLKKCGFCHAHKDTPTPDGKEEGKGGGDTTTLVDDDSWQNLASGDISDYDYSKADDISDVIYSGHVTDAHDTTYTGNEDYSSYGKLTGDDGDFSGQTPLPDGKEENPYIPPVPYKPPVELPTDVPPPPRPRVVPPRHESIVLNTKPVLNRTRVLDNSKVTKNPYKPPIEEEPIDNLRVKPAFVPQRGAVSFPPVANWKPIETIRTYNVIPIYDPYKYEQDHEDGISNDTINDLLTVFAKVSTITGIVADAKKLIDVAVTQIAAAKATKKHHTALKNKDKEAIEKATRKVAEANIETQGQSIGFLIDVSALLIEVDLGFFLAIMNLLNLRYHEDTEQELLKKIAKINEKLNRSITEERRLKLNKELGRLLFILNMKKSTYFLPGKKMNT